ncbi:hypothetical protein R0131_12365, partial [Clostridium sp. AL.422]|uniref:hypothetical protein n=1 Tax=Clostridium TaxID=1485 RepID=UPI00293DE300
YMEIKGNSYILNLCMNPTYKNDSFVNRDIFLNKYYKDNNIYLYRLWYRDWWIDKYKELDKIEEYIKKLTSLNK